MDKLSLLMPVCEKDNIPCLKTALESVLRQTVPASEIIVVSDGPLSNDLQNILNIFKNDITLVLLPKKLGLTGALNEGLKHCSCPLVARMDADDISVQNRFELQLKCFEQDSTLSVLGGYVEEFSDTSTKTFIRKVPTTDCQIKRFLKYRSPFNHPTVMFKKRDILKVGGYKDFYLLEDYHLWARLALSGAKMANIPQVLLRFRSGKQMFLRRGGYKYFCANKILFKDFLHMKIINKAQYFYNLAVRFCVQVLCPVQVREIFYKKVLR